MLFNNKPFKNVTKELERQWKKNQFKHASESYTIKDFTVILEKANTNLYIMVSNCPFISDSQWCINTDL